MFKYTLKIIILFLVSGTVYGQQDVYFSQYVFDKMIVNPAYTASSSWMVGSLKNRTMVSDIEGAPMTNIFTFQVPWQAQNAGFGLKVMQDKIAITNRLMASGIFSYHIGFGNGKLSFGLETGIINNKFDYSGLIRTVQLDPAIPEEGESVIMPDVSTGLFYQSRVFYIGASAYHLFNKKKTVPDYDNNEFYQLEKSYYAIGGVPIEISRDIILEPGFLVKYNHGVPFQTDFNLMFIWIDKFSCGLSYRTRDAALAMVKFDITKNLKLMYSYDYTVSPLRAYSKGNHEVGLSYGIELLPPPAKKVIHPRYYF